MSSGCTGSEKGTAFLLNHVANFRQCLVSSLRVAGARLLARVSAILSLSESEMDLVIPDSLGRIPERAGSVGSPRDEATIVALPGGRDWDNMQHDPMLLSS